MRSRWWGLHGIGRGSSLPIGVAIRLHGRRRSPVNSGVIGQPEPPSWPEFSVGESSRHGLALLRARRGILPNNT